MENDEKVRKNEGKPMKNEGKVMENKEKVIMENDEKVRKMMKNKGKSNGKRWKSEENYEKPKKNTWKTRKTWGKMKENQWKTKEKSWKTRKKWGNRAHDQKKIKFPKQAKKIPKKFRTQIPSCQYPLKGSFRGWKRAGHLRLGSAPGLSLRAGFGDRGEENQTPGKPGSISSELLKSTLPHWCCDFGWFMLVYVGFRVFLSQNARCLLWDVSLFKFSIYHKWEDDPLSDLTYQ